MRVQSYQKISAAVSDLPFFPWYDVPSFSASVPPQGNLLPLRGGSEKNFGGSEFKLRGSEKIFGGSENKLGAFLFERGGLP